MQFNCRVQRSLDTPVTWDIVSKVSESSLHPTPQPRIRPLQRWGATGGDGEHGLALMFTAMVTPSELYGDARRIDGVCLARMLLGTGLQTDGLLSTWFELRLSRTPPLYWRLR